MTMLIETSPLADLTPDRAAQRRRLIEQAWPGPDEGHDAALDPISLLLVDEGIVVASLDLLSKQLEHRGHSYRASGLSAVVTDAANRHRGYGQVLVRTARQELQNRGRDLALFTCDSYLGRFYAGCGFEVLPGTVLIGGTPEDPLRSDQVSDLGKLTFAAFYTTLAAAHRDDFIGTEIALYPGPIDRLW